MKAPKIIPKNPELEAFRKTVREAVANYMRSEGCSCCRGSDHEEHAEAMAKLLRVPKYSDGSGFNFSKYQTKDKP